MALSERLAYVLDFDVKGAIKGLEKVGATADKELGKTDKKLDKLSGNMTKFGVGAVAFAGVAGAGLVKLAGNASDLAESVNAVNVTFGDAAEGILKLGEEAARAVGLSKAEFNGLAVQFSSFATTVAGKGGDVVKTMDDITTRAADFASVMNLDVAEAARVFQSGLAGETEPLKKFGIDLSAAAVEAYAVANGITESGKAMTEAEKVQARYGALMEQTNKTAGDFANTSGGAANQQRIFKAELENLKAEIGTGVLPMFTSMLTAATKVTGAFSKLSPETKTMIGQFGAIGVAGIAVVGSLSAIAGQVIKMRTNFIGANGELNAFGKTAKGLSIGLGVAAVAYASFGAAAQGASGNTEWLDKDLKGVERLLTPMQKLGGLAFDLGRATHMTKAEMEAGADSWADYETEAAGAFDAMTAGVFTVGQLTAKLDKSTLSQNARNIITVKFKDSLEAQTEAEANLAAAIAEEEAATASSVEGRKEAIATAQAAYDEEVRLSGALSQAGEAARGADDMVEGLAAAQEVAAEAADKHREAEEKLMDFVNGQLSTVFDYEQATYDLATANQDLTEKIEEVEAAYADGTLTGGEYEQALRDLRSAEISTAQQALETAQAFAESQGAVDGSRESAQLQKEELFRLQQQFPQLRNEIQSYIDILNSIPATKTTTVVLNGTGARNDVNLVKGQYGGGRAIGGPVSAGMMYEVGEGGKPELFEQNGKQYLIPGNSGEVVPASGGSSGAAGGVHIGELHVHAGVNADGPEIARIIANKLREYQRFNGPGR